MISQEARDLFAANVKAMTAGDAAHLASQLLPDDVSRLKDIAYVHDGDAAHLLDIYTLADAEEGAALPVIVDFHGGGLYYGNKENNECRDMLLARQGFAVVNANYRLVPSVSFPAQLADAMAVLDWIRDHGAEYGLDAERVCVTGDSAGGALALYLCAANGSTQLAGALGLWQSGIEVHLKRATAGAANKPSLREILYRLPVHRISVCRIDDQYLAERNLPGSKTLAGLKVGLVGCGTIGGYLAEMLAKAGAGTLGGTLTLVDMGSLEPGNLGRHRLGFNALTKKKAEAICDELKRVAPGIDAVAVVGDVKDANLGPLDLLIDATGEQGLTDWLTWQYADQVPFLSTWVEGAGAAVRALMKAKPELACARCVSQPSLKDQYRVFDVPPEVMMKGHGCEGLYVPFPAAASVQAAALAMEMVQAWLDGAESPSFRTRVLDQQRKAHFKDSSPHRYEGCPACAT